MRGTHPMDFSMVFDVGSFRRNCLRLSLRVTGLPEMRFHDLRHTFASLMQVAGFPPYEVLCSLEHTNLATSDAIYARRYLSDYSSHVERFEAFVAGAPESH